MEQSDTYIKSEPHAAIGTLQTQGNQPAPPHIHVNSIPSSKKLKQLMLWYFAKSKLIKKFKWRKTAWVSAGFPVEFLWLFGVWPLHPENMACVAGARHTSQQCIEQAESMGYSRDLCSYCKTNIGAVDLNLPQTQGGIDLPDLIVTTNTICDTHWKWFQIQAEKHQIPFFVFDIPSTVSGTDEAALERYTDYIVDQLHDFIAFMEQHTGNRFNEKKYFRVLRKSELLCALWQEIYDYRKQIPTPVAYTDTLADIFPLVILPGINKGIRFYRSLLKDVKQRVAKHEGAMPPGTEKYRLLFEGIPFWYRIKFLHQLANYGAVVTYEPYTFSFGPRKNVHLSLDESFREFAKIVMINPYNYNLSARIAYFEQVIHEYHIDGVILHENMSCRPSSTGMIDLKNAIQEDCSIPVLLLQADMNDPRAFAEGPMQTRLEGFIELLAANQTQ